jgi:hypothetical protein
MKSMAKFIVTGKGQDLQKTNPDAQIPAWFHHCKTKSHPHDCDHLADTLQVIFEWDASACKTNDAKDVDIPVDFPLNLVRQYETVNRENIKSAPVKMDEAKYIMKLLSLDIRFLLDVIVTCNWDDDDTMPYQ